MEYAALNLLPILQSNAVTAGLIVNTPIEAFHRVVAEKDVVALLKDVVVAGVLGLATAHLPDVGIYTSPELVAYASAIGFAIPTVVNVLTGKQRLQDTSLAISLPWAAIGGVVDYLHAPISANHVAKDVARFVGIGK
jgi:hypothetical protein